MSDEYLVLKQHTMRHVYMTEIISIVQNQRKRQKYKNIKTTYWSTMIYGRAKEQGEYGLIFKYPKEHVTDLIVWWLCKTV